MKIDICANGTRSLLGLAALNLAILAGLPARSEAQTVVINFDDASVPAGGLIDATAYLASYGVTLSNVTPDGSVYIFNDNNHEFVEASSGDNYLLQQVSGAPNGITYTLNFATPLSQLSFTRIANVTPNLVAEWSATAYAGSTALQTVSEPFGEGPFSPAVYSFSGTDITSLTFTSNGNGSAGITSAAIDDLTLTEIPEPPAYAAILATAALCLAVGRRMKAAPHSA